MGSSPITATKIQTLLNDKFMYRSDEILGTRYRQVVTYCRSKGWSENVKCITTDQMHEIWTYFFKEQDEIALNLEISCLLK